MAALPPYGHGPPSPPLLAGASCDYSLGRRRSLQSCHDGRLTCCGASQLAAHRAWLAVPHASWWPGSPGLPPSVTASSATLQCPVDPALTLRCTSCACSCCLACGLCSPGAATAGCDAERRPPPPELPTGLHLAPSLWLLAPLPRCAHALLVTWISDPRGAALSVMAQELSVRHLMPRLQLPMVPPMRPRTSTAPAQSGLPRVRHLPASRPDAAALLPPACLPFPALHLRFFALGRRGLGMLENARPAFMREHFRLASACGRVTCGACAPISGSGSP
jgi:hypothetical protein